jgi:template-activating factor I
LEENEEECLHYMSKLVVEDHINPKTGYSISFHFEENPFFFNEVITKELHFTENGSSSTSTPINWIEGKSLNSNFQLQSNAKNPMCFFEWFSSNSGQLSVEIARLIKDELWPNPMKYFLHQEFDEPEEGSGKESDESKEESDEESDQGEEGSSKGSDEDENESSNEPDESEREEVALPI